VVSHACGWNVGHETSGSVDDVANSMRSAHRVLGWLQQGESIVVHCAAGLHRTGVFLYVLLRLAGHSRQKVLDMIREIRPLSAKELQSRDLVSDEGGPAEVIFVQVKKLGPQASTQSGVVANAAAQKLCACGNDEHTCSVSVKVPLQQHSGTNATEGGECGGVDETDCMETTAGIGAYASG